MEADFSMKKFSETEINVRNQHITHINQRWNQLYYLEKESGDKALRYLLLTNSGGAIATLGFLGAFESATDMLGVKLSLFLFIIGIILLGVSVAKQYHHMSKLFNLWMRNTNRYFRDEIDYDSMNKKDDNMAVEDCWDFVIPYSSFACFVLGCITGLTSLLCNS